MIIERTTVTETLCSKSRKRRIQGMLLIASVFVCSPSEDNKGIVNPIKARLLFLRPLKIKFYITSSGKKSRPDKVITEEERNG